MQPPTVSLHRCQHSTMVGGRGATFLHRGRQGPYTWVTIADPEGNELCLS
jgi:hypothetical protein